jgi:quinolinate synthase
MLKFVKESAAKRFIIATEVGIIYPLQKQRPDAEFIPASEHAVCPNMKKITLEKIIWSLEDLKFKITIPQDVRLKAKKSLDRMIEVLPSPA